MQAPFNHETLKWRICDAMIVVLTFVLHDLASLVLSHIIPNARLAATVEKLVDLVHCCCMCQCPDKPGAEVSKKKI